MYYLIFRDLRTDTSKIVSNCVNSVHRGVIVKNYCTKENITLVQYETDIEGKCIDTNLFCYKIDEFEYIKYLLFCLYCSIINRL